MEPPERDAIPHEDLDGLQEAMDRVVKGVRDLDAACIACDEMDRARDEMRRHHGERHLAVNLIRESRNEQ